MFPDETRDRITSSLHEIDDLGLRKDERVLSSPQGRNIQVESQKQGVLNFCANNYLGLANHPKIIEAAKDALDEWGFGLASVRFICGTQSIHKQLEEKISSFLGMDDTILYSSCFDANGGLFETILGPDDAVISDSLNHASIIDGIRLCKARRFRYASGDMDELAAQLKEAKNAGSKTILIATDGVFSMDGHVAKLPAICDLADEFEALVMVDDSHASGFFGPEGRGTPAFHEVAGRVDIVTSTLGKALGGASGGFTAARREIVDLLRQRSRPYLFSNSVAPPLVASTLAVLDLVCSEEGEQGRRQLESNTKLFRKLIAEGGFDIIPGEHPITPVMIGDAKLAVQMADALLQEGIYVIAFSYPVVPEGKARIRVQVSAAHTENDLHQAVEAFAKVKSRAGIKRWCSVQDLNL